MEELWKNSSVIHRPRYSSVRRYNCEKIQLSVGEDGEQFRGWVARHHTKEVAVSDAVLGAVLSAVITGVFTLIGTRMEARHSTASGGSTNSAPTVGPMQPAMQPAAGTTNYGRVLIDIGILQLILNLVGFVIGYSIGAAMAGTATVADIMGVVFTVILVVGTILLSIGFFWRSLLVDRSVRWRHFSFVAVGVALTTLVLNSIMMPGANLNAVALVFAFAQTFICMGVGVGLANRTGR